MSRTPLKGKRSNKISPKIDDEDIQHFDIPNSWNIHHKIYKTFDSMQISRYISTCDYYLKNLGDLANSGDDYIRMQHELDTLTKCKSYLSINQNSDSIIGQLQQSRREWSTRADDIAVYLKDRIEYIKKEILEKPAKLLEFQNKLITAGEEREDRSEKRERRIEKLQTQQVVTNYAILLVAVLTLIASIISVLRSCSSSH